MRRKKLSWYQWFLGHWPYLFLLWLFTGFALGTLILLFPLRTWVNYTREQELSDAVEKMGVVAMMVVLAIVSFLISLQIFRWHLKKKSALVTVLATLIPFCCAAAALALFMNPNLVNKGSEAEEFSQQFTIGPYPTEDRVKKLKEEGYTGIISLLHPAVVPFEPSLLAEEEKATRKYGVALVKAPMLPWIGDNSASLKKIEELVKSNKGRYYIHCYLGKDRVNVVKNLVARLTGDSTLESEMGSTHRTFEKKKHFERGEIYKLGEDIYMTPYPTDEEFLSFFLAGRIKSVVNLMDAGVDRNEQWISKEKTELEKAGVAFRQFSVTDGAREKTIIPFIDSILALPRPIVIHRWKTSSADAAMIRSAFTKKTGVIPVNLDAHVSETP